MIFCIDIGNTNIKYAVYNQEKLIATFRVRSKQNSTSDEYGVIVRDLLASAKINKEEIEGVIMSSVIPSINYTMEHMCKDYLGLTPIIVGPGVKTGINIKADNPREVGSDIICDCVSAFTKYGGKTPIIVVDFGTATTFDAITVKGELVGVAIAPGLKSALDSLVNGTAKLPNIELEKPNFALGKNTVNCMQSGLIFGFAGLVKEIIRKFKLELGENAKVVATGGLGAIIKDEANCIDFYDRTLTLDGLKFIYNMNKQL